jgi:hypothetical protein
MSGGRRIGSLLGIGGYFESRVLFLKRKIKLIFAQSRHNERQNQGRKKYDPYKTKKQGKH